MAILISFRVEQTTERRGYIYFDLQATFSDGQRLLSMSHDTRLEALTALGEAVERAAKGLKIQPKRKALLKKAFSRPFSFEVEIKDKIATPNYPMGVRLTKTARR